MLDRITFDPKITGGRACIRRMRIEHPDLEHCRIGRNVRTVNSQRIEHSADADDCVIRDGIPVVVNDAMLPDSWKL